MMILCFMSLSSVFERRRIMNGLCNEVVYILEPDVVFNKI